MKKKLTIPDFVSLAAIAIAAPVLTLAILVSARAAAVGGNDPLLFALALCGAVLSGVNGFGRRTIKANFDSRRGRKVPQSKVALPARAGLAVNP
ncbi:MAG: hypothetical protein ACREBC_36370 [Pyrinomonadaceae bacterium]